MWVLAWVSTLMTYGWVWATIVLMRSGFLSIKWAVFPVAADRCRARERSLRGRTVMGHDPGGGRAGFLSGHRGGPGWRRPPATVGQFIGKAPKGASFVMSHNRSEATNTNPASRSRTSHVKTHRFVSHHLFGGSAPSATGRMPLGACPMFHVKRRAIRMPKFWPNSSPVICSRAGYPRPGLALTIAAILIRDGHRCGSIGGPTLVSFDLTTPLR